MIALEKARRHLEHLGLGRAAAVLGSLPQAAQRQVSYAYSLVDLLGIEAQARRERYLRTRTRLAHLPFHKTLEQFDFSFQPSSSASRPTTARRPRPSSPPSCGRKSVPGSSAALSPARR